MYVKNAGLSRLPTCSYPKGDLKKRKGKGTQADMVFYEREFLSGFKALIPNPFGRQ
jgi:hypothetical protein